MFLLTQLCKYSGLRKPFKVRTKNQLLSCPGKQDDSLQTLKCKSLCIFSLTFWAMKTSKKTSDTPLLKKAQSVPLSKCHLSPQCNSFQLGKVVPETTRQKSEP